jgi:hypothetical protein
MEANPGITHSSFCKDIVFTRAWHNINAVRREQRRRKEGEKGEKKNTRAHLGFCETTRLTFPEIHSTRLAIVGMEVGEGRH